MSSEVSREYSYEQENGKTKVTKRNYSVKNPNTLKSKENKLKFDSYLKEHKEEISKIEPKILYKYLIQKAKEDLNLEISKNGIKSALERIK